MKSDRSTEAVQMGAKVKRPGKGEKGKGGSKGIYINNMGLPTE